MNEEKIIKGYEALICEHKKERDNLKAENAELLTTIMRQDKELLALEEIKETLKAEVKDLNTRLKRTIELPFIAMLERQLDESGKFDKSKAEQSKNGRYCVVYKDETLWKIPLIDVCSRQIYGREFAEARLNEIKQAEAEKALKEKL